MKICLVTTFPPSQGGLSEYGLHIAEELRRNPFLSLTILADQISSPETELADFSVVRCWSFDDPLSAVRLLHQIRKLKPDVVWFNLLFSTFGRNPLNAFLGLLTPLLARLSGCYTHVTLHHLMDTVDLKDAGVRHARAYRLAGDLATRMLLLSNSVSVLMPGYRNILHEKYGRDNVHLRAHGILTTRPEYPDFSRRGNPEHRILAFGKWGTYKRLELMIEAFEIVAQSLPKAKLVIAGGDHPLAPSYVESIRQEWAGNPRIEFTGYVPEDQLPGLFQSATVAVMPYSSSTGCSGVAHLACAYGVPVLCADLPDFRQMADSEEIAIEFYKPGDAQDLASSLIRFLTNPARQEEMAAQNYFTALRMTMPTIVQKYLRHFELDQRAETLRQITRFRRLPNWLPSKALMLKLMTRKSSAWIYRSGVRRPSLNVPVPKSLLNDYGNGNGGKRTETGVPINCDGIALRSSIPAAGGDHADTDDGDESDRLNRTLPLTVAAEGEADDPERQQPTGIDRDGPSLLRQINPRDGDRRNGNG
jgi:glycosyltransferase involved in cell wall biosynthesis